jgi:hypothetical protein
MNISSIARRPFFDKFFLAPSMPGFLRLALIDSLSYNSKTQTGGAINNFRSSDFKKLKCFHGLKKHLSTVEEINLDGNHITTMLTMSDLIQLGGASAIHYCNGPFIDVP